MRKKKHEPLKMSGSNFDRNERFGLSNAPKHFESITDEEMDRIREAVLSEVEDISQFKPGALKDILQSVDGHYSNAYSTLEGDYGKRISNLDMVRNRGLKNLRKAFKVYELQIVNHNTVFQAYSEANRIINGEELPDRLRIADEDVDEMQATIKKLDERSIYG